MAALLMVLLILLRGPAGRFVEAPLAWVGWAITAIFMLSQVCGLMGLFAYFAIRGHESKVLIAIILSVSGGLLCLLVMGQYLLALPSAIHFAACVPGLRTIAPVFIIALLIGLAVFAVTIWRDSILPRWSGALLLIGQLLFIGPLYLLELLAGVLVCIGWLWMAWRIRGGQQPSYYPIVRHEMERAMSPSHTC